MPFILPCQTTFKYDSPFWTNKETLNVDAGLDGLTQNETKLASFHNTAFAKLCLGMTANDVTNWIVVHHTATSLHSVMNGKKNQKTNAGRAEWMSLMNGSRLPPNCNKEGFKVRCGPNESKRKCRIGILASEQNDCKECGSVTGFGFDINGKKGSSGNFYSIEYVNFSFGYIFVQ